MDRATEIQLGIVAEVTQCLTAQGIPHWLDGGWAIDFLLGQITRPHSDVDWLIWETSRDRVSESVISLGYTSQVVRHPDEHLGFWRHDQYVSFTLNMLNEDGQVVTCGRWADWPYPPGAFEGPDGHLGDIQCPVLSAEAQLDVRENFHRHPAGGPRRDVDAPDIGKLRAIISQG